MYLGGYEKEEHAAEAYDMAALKTKGFSTVTNFSKDRCAFYQARIWAGVCHRLIFFLQAGLGCMTARLVGMPYTLF